MIDEKDRRIKELEEEIVRLSKEKDKISQEKDKIEKEFEEFKAKHAITVDNLKKAMKIKASSKLKRKPSGAKKGHVAYTRHIPERIDSIKFHIPKRCPDCNTRLTGKSQKKSELNRRLCPEYHNLIK